MKNNTAVPTDISHVGAPSNNRNEQRVPRALSQQRRRASSSIRPKDPLVVGVGARIMNIKFVRNVNVTLMFLSDDTIAILWSYSL